MALRQAQFIQLPFQRELWNNFSIFSNTLSMKKYYSYHATAKNLIRKGKLKDRYICEKYNSLSPALVLVFDDAKHPVMPIREYRWDEYFALIGEYEKTKK